MTGKVQVVMEPSVNAAADALGFAASFAVFVGVRVEVKRVFRRVLLVAVPASRTFQNAWAASLIIVGRVAIRFKGRITARVQVPKVASPEIRRLVARPFRLRRRRVPRMQLSQPVRPLGFRDLSH